MPITADAFDPLLEIAVYSFSTFEDWQRWRRENPWFGLQTAPKEIADHCLEHGISSGWFGHIPPSNVTCTTPNYRESLRGHGFNPRQRAVLETLHALTRGREQDVRIYAAEGITPFARQLRERYPNFIGSEYAPTAEDQARIAPVAHQDLADLTYPNESFDICITNEVFEHLPELSVSIAELYRVLAPGGVLICTFPFLHNRLDTITKARMLEGGEIEHLMTPEYHGNPVNPEGGSLVFQIPAWDILETTSVSTFKRRKITLVYSKRAGLTSREYAGVFIFLAEK